MNNFYVKIGLEVHAQVNVASKLFSYASTSFGAMPNSQVDLFDVSTPGTMPYLNKECVDKAIMTGFALNAEINKDSFFERKHYFYPDLPSGYQITQQTKTIVGNGSVEINDPIRKKIRIRGMHLEQDAGKSIHDIDAKYSYIDYNRSGVPLMEIVTYPDMTSAAEAAAFVRKLRILLLYIDACDGSMEEGSMRADVNISLSKSQDEFGQRVEIKNVNSMKFIEKAIEYEIERQSDLLLNNLPIKKETRLFDSSTNTTFSMRSKETAEDYRYMIEPDLPPIILTNERIEIIKKLMPEMPDAKKERFMTEYKLEAYESDILCVDPKNAQFYEKAVEELEKLIQIDIADYKQLSNWIIVDLFAYLKNAKIEISDSKIGPNKIAELVFLIKTNILSIKIARECFQEIADYDKIIELIDKKGLRQIDDDAVIIAAINEVLQEESKSVEDYKNGKIKMFDFFVGQVMKKTKGKANAVKLRELMTKALIK